MSLLDHSDDQDVLLKESDKREIRQVRKNESDIAYLVASLEKKPLKDQPIGMIRYSGQLFYKPFGRFHWKPKTLNIVGDMVSFTNEEGSTSDHRKLSWWFAFDIDKEDTLSALGINSKKRFILVVDGELVEVGFESDQANDTLMKKLRKIMRKKYTSEEIDEKIALTEELHPQLEKMEELRKKRYAYILSALNESLFVSDTDKKIKEGYLEQRTRKKEWRRYYCVLYSDCFYIFLPNSKASKNNEPFDWIENSYIQKVKPLKQENEFSVRTTLRRFVFKAKHGIAAKEWINAFVSCNEASGEQQSLESADLGYTYTKNIDGKLSLEYNSGDKLKLKKLNKGKEALVGRSSSCTVRLVEDKQVSRLHCRIVVENNVPYVIDLGSSAGTKVNGENVIKQALAPEDIISVGSTKMRFIVKDGHEVFHRTVQKDKKKKKADKIELD